MFKKLRYRLKLDAALGELGMEPEHCGRALRNEALLLGLREGLQPREAALELLSVVYPGLSLVDRLRILAVIRRWHRRGSVREVHCQRALEGGRLDLQAAALRGAEPSEPGTQG